MKGYTQLEFNKIKNVIKSYCQCSMNYDIIDKIQPINDLSKIRYKLELTHELKILLEEGFRFSFSGIQDVKQMLLSPPSLTFNFEEFKLVNEIVLISNIIREKTIDSNKKDDSWSDLHQNSFPKFSEIVQDLHYFPELNRRFSEIFSPEGDILDSASTELKNIRKSFSTIRNSIFKQLNTFLQNSGYENAVQDKIITQRDNRYCIPVKEGSQSIINGVIHGRSSSGSSLFIEPINTVELNNSLQSAREDEKREIHRILTEFTAILLEHHQEIISNQKNLEKLDLYYSIAYFSSAVNGRVPELTHEKVLEFHKARHPLLMLSFNDTKKVIPFDLSIGKDYRILILSGPNTGGKTVTMKSAGLLTVMALSGIPIPAENNTKIGLFSKFFTDIGDDQSLEDSLSTFSSHIKNIQEMLNSGDENSLIFIDEIGASTDPEQGSALAQAILEALIERNVIGIITTHYSNLKLFAEQEAVCLNASMEFNHNQHTPTYNLIQGFPGNSFAFEISKKLGLEQKILNRAKSLAGNQNVELTELLLKLAEEKKKLAQTSYQMDLKSRNLDQRIMEYESKIVSLECEQKRLKKESLKQTQEYLSTVQIELDTEISKLKKLEAGKKKSELKKIAKKVTVKSDNLKEEYKRLAVEDLLPLQKPATGKKVWVQDFEGIGEIIDFHRNSVKVSLNGFTLTTETSKVYEVPQDLLKSTKVESHSRITVHKTPKIELKVIGKTFDQTIPLIDDFVDDAFSAGLDFVRIVHGKGSGILREKIRKYLAKDNRVSDMWSPAPEAGGDGVTVVSLK